MPALVAGIHVLRRVSKKGVDGRDKPGHDDHEAFAASSTIGRTSAAVSIVHSRSASSAERAAPRILEMLHLDGAPMERKPDQEREAQLRAGVIVPAGVGVLGRDAIGLDV